VILGFNSQTRENASLCGNGSMRENAAICGKGLSVLHDQILVESLLTLKMELYGKQTHIRNIFSDYIFIYIYDTCTMYRQEENCPGGKDRKRIVWGGKKMGGELSGWLK